MPRPNSGIMESKYRVKKLQFLDLTPSKGQKHQTFLDILAFSKIHAFGMIIPKYNHNNGMNYNL